MPQMPTSSPVHSYSSSSSIGPLVIPPTSISTGSPTANDTDGGLMSWLGNPMYQLFGVVGVLFALTVLLGLVNFCIWYIEKRQRRGPVHWRQAPIVDLSVTGSRPITQPPKRSFHIQHALYKQVRRPSSMPP